jgi:hypothetical protein
MNNRLATFGLAIVITAFLSASCSKSADNPPPGKMKCADGEWHDCCIDDDCSIPDCSREYTICNNDYECECVCYPEGKDCSSYPENCCDGLACDVSTETCMTGCTDASDCGSSECCSYNVCKEIGDGCQCGDNTGTCGAPCACQLDTACAPGYRCLYSESNLDDPRAHCSKPCATDRECWDSCSTDIRGADFRCEALPGTDKVCDLRTSPCPFSRCYGGNVCIPLLSIDETRLEGWCGSYGEHEIGTVCDEAVDPNTLPYEERCIGAYCINGHCSQMCYDSTDCAASMVCGLHPFDMPAGGTEEAGMCLWFDGTLVSCTQDGDCGAGEVCFEYRDREGQAHKICVVP